MDFAKTILVRLWGGLGNQMYQYALARNLSLLNNNAQIKLDISYFDNYYWPFELDKLNIKASIANKQDIFDFDNGSLSRKAGHLIEKIPWIRVKDFIRKPFSKVYTEPKVSFNSEVLNIRHDVYLKGYWSSYKYFDDIREVLLEDFSFKEEMNEENLRMCDLILSSESSVSLHVRRGDYVSLPNAKKFFRSPYDDGFYDKAISEIELRVNNPEFFLFSDDPEWVKDNIKIKHKCTLVNINKKNNNYWDMKLMSLCKHNIIANSSFSWWAAYLNRNKDKIVCAPKVWFNDSKYVMEDIIPTYYIIL